MIIIDEEKIAKHLKKYIYILLPKVNFIFVQLLKSLLFEIFNNNTLIINFYENPIFIVSVIRSTFVSSIIVVT